MRNSMIPSRRFVMLEKAVGAWVCRCRYVVKPSVDSESTG